MTAFERLMSLSGKPLEVTGVKRCSGILGDSMLDVAVQYSKCYVKDYLHSPIMSSVFGRGHTFEEACEDYINKISGKVLIFETLSGGRETITVL